MTDLDDYLQTLLNYTDNASQFIVEPKLTVVNSSQNLFLVADVIIPYNSNYMC